MFSVVHFRDGVQLVATKWIEGKKCFYPRYYTQERIDQSVKEQEEPGKDWRRYDVLRIFGTSTTFERGLQKANLATMMSEIGTEEETPFIERKRKVTKRVQNYEMNEFLASEDIRRMQWPSKSPDLNFIEHVWDALGRLVASLQLPLTSVPELKTALHRAWNVLPQLINALTESMNSRCTACLATRETVRSHVQATNVEVGQLIAKWLVQAKLKKMRADEKKQLEEHPAFAGETGDDF